MELCFWFFRLFHPAIAFPTSISTPYEFWSWNSTSWTSEYWQQVCQQCSMVLLLCVQPVAMRLRRRLPWRLRSSWLRRQWMLSWCDDGWKRRRRDDELWLPQSVDIFTLKTTLSFTRWRYLEENHERQDVRQAWGGESRGDWLQSFIHSFIHSLIHFWHAPPGVLSTKHRHQSPE